MLHLEDSETTLYGKEDKKMAVTTFAAIDIGSYELMLKVYEMNGRSGLKQLDCVRYRLDLGKDTYTAGRISLHKLNELCEQLQKFKEIMKSYGVEQYRVCTTSAIRETENTGLVLEQMKTKTGMSVEILSNSEQRFLEYKALATREETFNEMIQKETAVADIGGGSLQMSLFDKDRLIATQNMRLGAVRIRERLEESSYRSARYITMIEELIENDLEVFERLYLQERKLKNIIVTGEVATRLIHGIGMESPFISGKQYLRFYKDTIFKSPEQIGTELGMSPDYTQMIYPVMVLLRSIIKRTKTEALWAPDTHLCDGMAYDYAVSRHLVKEKHNFEEDILAAAGNIARRYMCNQEHTDIVRSYAVQIFDAMKKVHGLGKRERLLLEIITMIHDCGKYISLAYAPQSAYNIIMSTEIIGLSHLEREIVANTVMYHTLPMPRQEMLLPKLGEKAYLTVYKLSAILKVANVLDRSHKQKITAVHTVLKDGELIITAAAKEEIALEKQLFREKARFFEEVFCVKINLKIKVRG